MFGKRIGRELGDLSDLPGQTGDKSQGRELQQGIELGMDHLLALAEPDRA